MDDVTRDALTELEFWQKEKDNPNFVTKQLLRNNICLTCWRIAMTDEGRYYCGSPRIDGKKEASTKAEGKIIEKPRTETCAFYVKRYDKRFSS